MIGSLQAQLFTIECDTKKSFYNVLLWGRTGTHISISLKFVIIFLKKYYICSVGVSFLQILADTAPHKKCAPNG